MLIKRHQLLSFSIVLLLPIPFPVPTLLVHPSSNSLTFYSPANMSLHPHDETVPIRVEDVTFNRNPRLFFSGMQFNITLFCNRVLTGGIYVFSPLIRSLSLLWGLYLLLSVSLPALFLGKAYILFGWLVSDHELVFSCSNTMQDNLSKRG